MNRTVVVRAFGVLGPTIAAAAMGAFLLSMWAAGWRIGGSFPDAAGIAAASGATFMTVVLAQSANAFACRSSTRRPGQLGWFTNRYLPITVALELGFALTVLWVAPIAGELDHANPPLWGWALAIASIPLLLLVDALEKRRRAAPDQRS
jgi:magnesium-transporting ATPase (P-type)